MTEGHDLADLLDDLESFAAAGFQADRDDELADRSRSEYLQVSLASRLMAELDSSLGLDVQGVGTLHGTLVRLGTDWLVLHVHQGDWLVRHAALLGVRGAGTRAVPEVAWPVTARLGLGSALRRLADAEAHCSFHLLSGDRVEGTPCRVGADFVELRVAEGQLVLLAIAALAAVRQA